MNSFKRLFMMSGMAFIVSLLTGLVMASTINLEISLHDRIACYLVIAAPLTALYLRGIKRLYAMPVIPRFWWFMVRAVVINQMFCIFVTALVMLIARFDDSIGSGYAVGVTYLLIWFNTLLHIGHDVTALRPFVRGDSDTAPWRHHDGGLNSPDALFFRSPPEWLGEILSAGSSVRRGEELPPVVVMVCIGFWIAAQACLLAQAILSSIRLPYLANIQFYFIYFVLLTVIPGMIILLVRRRTCSYVGTAGAVQYDMAFDRTVEEWSIRFADCRTLKKSTVNSYRNGIYVTTTETRCFETADGGEQLFSYNWDNPEKISCFIPGVMPDVRATFWQKIESLWAMRGG